jgi:hypothetical protein
MLLSRPLYFSFSKIATFSLKHFNETTLLLEDKKDEVKNSETCTNSTAELESQN